MRLLLVFLLTALVDLFWAKYIRHVAAKRATLAAFHSTYIILIGGVCTLLYVMDPHTILAAGAGAFVGTWVSVKFL